MRVPSRTPIRTATPIQKYAGITKRTGATLENAVVHAAAETVHAPRISSCERKFISMRPRRETNISKTYATNNRQLFRLQVHDSTTNKHFLLDTGADVCVLPLAVPTFDLRPTDTLLYATNGTPIKVIGEQIIKPNLSLGREFCWLFVVAAVTSPIIGADFIRHYDLRIDLRRN